MDKSNSKALPESLPDADSTPHPLLMAEKLMKLGESIQQIAMQGIASHHKSQWPFMNGMMNPWAFMETFKTLGVKILENPQPAIDVSVKYFSDYLELCSRMLTAGNCAEIEKVIEPSAKDKRFKDASWTENKSFSFLMQSYLLWDRWVHDVANSLDSLDKQQQHKVQFYSRQIADAFSPTNYPWGNPVVFRKTLETNGQNLLQGMQHLLNDLQEGEGRLKISMVNQAAFKVGVNIATTAGQVIYQNDLIQLIQYAPTTEKVHETPVLLIPPCINKFYIYDLREDNSFVRWLIDQGFTVFMLSWVNPDERLSHKSFEDYITEGIEQAVEVCRDLCQVSQINAVGFCIGGNFLTCYTAYRTQASKSQHPLASTTYFATLFDFKNAGDLMVFIDEEQIRELEEKVQKQGYFKGSELAQTFNLLRANDLIWSFVVNNYLLGKEPQAFDMLFWNADSTNLPADMYLYYLRNFFLKNLLLEPGALKIRNYPVDLSTIKVPAFIVSTREDHIAPWESGFAGAQAFAGPAQFVLGGSGHIAGIFNHPESQKYYHLVGDHKGLTAEKWYKQATRQEGSWWPSWVTWLKEKSGPRIKARKVGTSKYPPLEAAPGSYVL